LEIVGRALWHESRTKGRSAYHIKDGDYTQPVEYINGTWYHIHWTIAETYEVSRNDKIKDLLEAGLGTKSQPFLFTPDLERIHTELTQDSDKTPKIKIVSPESDPDIPTTDQANAPVIEQLTQAMAQAAIAVAHVQPAQAGGPAQAQQPPAGQPQQPPPDNHNNLPLEDNPAEEEVAAEAVEEEEVVEEVAEANQQQDNKLRDRQQPHHLAAKLSKE
jgi:hypothetical protein